MMTDLSTLVCRTDWLQLRRLLAVLPDPMHRAWEQELLRAKICEPHQLPDDVVRMGSRVRLVETLSGRVSELQLCYPEQLPQPDALSVLSAAGRALLGLRVGQHIHWPLPDKRLAFIRILSVDSKPVAAASRSLAAMDAG